MPLEEEAVPQTATPTPRLAPHCIALTQPQLATAPLSFFTRTDGESLCSRPILAIMTATMAAEP